MKKFILFLAFLVASTAFAQVGIGTTTPKAQLDIKSSNQATPANNDGILIPKIDAFPAINPTSVQDGMMVFLTTTIGANPKGFYYWNTTTTTWIAVSGNSASWLPNGNSNNTIKTIGTNDNFDLPIETNGTEKLRITTDGKIGINTSTPDPSAVLDITSTNSGVLLPRMTTAQRDLIMTPKLGLTIYNTSNNKFQGYVGGVLNLNTDQQQTFNNSTENGFSGDVGQTFTARITGLLTAIEINMSGFGYSGILNVNGTNFTTINLVNGINLITLTAPFSVTAGTIYNFRISMTFMNTLRSNDANLYADGGVLYASGIISSTRDLYFKTFVQTIIEDWTNLNGLTSGNETDPKVGILAINKIPKWNGTSLSSGLVIDNGSDIDFNGKTKIAATTNGEILMEGTKNTFRGLEWAYSGGNNDRYGFAQAPGGNAAMYTAGGFASSFLSFNKSNSAGTFDELARITNAGNMGIGDSNPSDKLAVNGKTKTTNLQVTTATASVIGQVLTATDVNGNMAWQTPVAVAPNEIQKIGTIIRNTTDTATDNFVIGSTSMDDIGGGITTDNSRMFFNKAKWAFRAGSVQDDSWDDSKVGIGSFGAGTNNIASGINSTASGANTLASGNTSTAIGSQTRASGTTSTAIGVGTTASGNFSTAIGSATTASGNVSTAMGLSTTASGNFSTAMGSSTVASGVASTAIGAVNTASGAASTALGSATYASGNASTAMGNSTSARSLAETSIGINNTDYTPTGSVSFDATDRIFSIGNGISTATRSNALTILKNGNTAIGNINPTQKLQLADGNILLSNTGTAGEIRFGEPSAMGTNFTAFKAGVQSNDITYTLPTMTPIAGQVLQSTAAGDLSWQTPVAANITAWSLTGNNVLATDFLGTTNNQDVIFKRNNINAGRIGLNNTALGNESQFNVPTGANNTSFGAYSLKSNTTAEKNVAIGIDALRDNQIGTQNTAVGSFAMQQAQGVSPNKTCGIDNVAFGTGALQVNGGNFNSGIGAFALQKNTTGSNNTAAGNGSLFNNTTGIENTAVGSASLKENITGSNNGAFGTGALRDNQIGSRNNAIGQRAMASAQGTIPNKTSGNDNTAIGFETMQFNGGNANLSIGNYAMRFNTTGAENIAIGLDALRDNEIGSQNTAIGLFAMQQNFGTSPSKTSGNDNVGIGYEALKFNNGNANTIIGNYAMRLNTTGIENTAIGLDALRNNNLGSHNTAIGFRALQFLQLTNTLSLANSNTALGYNAARTQTDGANNLAIGANTALPSLTGSNQMSIANVIYGLDLNTTATGKIGIRNNNPTEALDVTGKTKTTSLQVITSTAPVIGQVLTANDVLGNTTWQTPSISGTTETADNGLTKTLNNIQLGGNLTANTTITQDTAESLTISNNATANTTINLQNTGDFDIQDNGATAFFVGDNGNVGIGTNVPNAALQFSNNLTNRKLALYATTTNTHQFYGFGVTANVLRYQTPASADDHVFYSGLNASISNELMRVKGNGNIGIGTPTPTEKLDVDGKTKTTNLQVITSTAPVIGQVLTANDALGNAVWQTPAAASELQKFGNIIRNTTNTGSDSFVIGSTSLDDIGGGVITDDIRLFFSKSKGAFRAGQTEGNQWNNFNIGQSSFATGFKTTASGEVSTAMGNNTTASGFNAFALGSQTTASGLNSTAIGNFTMASGQNSTAMGTFTNASGVNTTAMGSSTIASGFTSIAMGSETTALGNVSTAMGLGTIAKSLAETVVGSNNTNYTIAPNGDTSFQATDRIFSVGNGTGIGATPKSNALTILKNGNTAIGNINPTEKLEVDGKTKTTNLHVTSTAAIGIATSDSSAILDLTSTTAGMLLPRMTTAQRDLINTPKVGLAIYNTTEDKFQGYTKISNSGFDQQQVLTSALSSGFSIGQSFTAGKTGFLTSIEIDLETGVGSTYTLTLNGTNSTACSLVYGSNTITLSVPFAVVAGTQYTFLINTSASTTFFLRSRNLNPYSGGQLFNNSFPFPTIDLYFKTMVQTNIESWQNLNEQAVSIEVDPTVSSTISNNIPKWNGTTLTDGLITDNGSGVGVLTTSPNSTFEVNGTIALKAYVGNTNNNPSNSIFSIYIYLTNIADITFPVASTCPNRTYKIVNKSTTTIVTSNYFNLLGNPIAYLQVNKYIEIVSDGTNWHQIGGN